MADTESPKLSPSELARLMHWSQYGHPSTSSATRVLLTDWHLGSAEQSFSKPQTSAWNVAIPSSSIPKLINGFCPRQMEEKWFVYSEGPLAESEGAVNGGAKFKIMMHRSWTDKLIYEVLFEVFKETEAEKEDQEEAKSQTTDEKTVKFGGRITELIWESDNEIITAQNEAKAMKGVREVCRWVLGAELGEDEEVTG